MNKLQYLKHYQRDLFRKEIFKLEKISSSGWISESKLDELIQKHESHLNKLWAEENKDSPLNDWQDLGS